MRRIEPRDILPIRKFILCITQKEFAEMLGLTQQAVQRWEKGHTRKFQESTTNRIEASVFQVIPRETLFKLLDQYHEDIKRKGDL